MNILFNGLTDPGKIRKENQDSFGILEQEKVFFVCDGMGGHASGDFASRVASEIIKKSLSVLSDEEIINSTETSSTLLPERSLKILTALRVANSVLYGFSQKFNKLEGMGTTITLLQYNETDATIDIFNVGDSRIYLIRENEIYLRTKDHSKVAELIEEGKMSESEVKTAEIQSMITRALGIKKSTKIDYRTDSIVPGDRLILCSDGLNCELENKEIKNIATAEPDIAQVPAKLVEAALAKGGKDNVTVIAIEFSGHSSFDKRPSKPLITLEEESVSENKWIEKAGKNILALSNIQVPKSATKQNWFSNPLISGVLLCLILITLILFVKKADLVIRINPIDVTRTECLMKVAVRTPTSEQLEMLNRTEDRIQKLQLIQDWYANIQETTRPVHNAEILIKNKNGAELKGLSSEVAYEANVQRGVYTVSAIFKDFSLGGGSSRARNYFIITSKMQKLASTRINIEVGEQEKLVILVILPEDQFLATGGQGGSE